MKQEESPHFVRFEGEAKDVEYDVETVTFAGRPGMGYGQGGWGGRIGGGWGGGGGMSQTKVLSFRLQVFDEASGDLQRTVPVEIRGQSLEGRLRNGDRVRVEGLWKDQTRPMNVNEVHLIETNTRIGAVPPPAFLKWLMIGGVGIIAAWMGLLAILFLTNISSGSDSGSEGIGSGSDGMVRNIEVQLSPDSGPFNSDVLVRASGFQADERVEVSFGGMPAAVVKADANGNISTSVNVPEFFASFPGVKPVWLRGETSHRDGQASFEVVSEQENGAPTTPARPVQPLALTLTPDTGPVESEFTLNGSGFEPEETVEIRFHAIQVATLVADTEGRVSSPAIRVPSFFKNLPGARPVVAFGQTSFKQAKATFVVIP